MKKFLCSSRCALLVLLFAFSEIISADGQSIRKHYTQFTEAERAAFEAALDYLYANGTVDFYADIHADPDQDGLYGNNFNGPDFDSYIHRVNIFLPWHRQFIAEFELELQAYNPKLSLPYWDWTGDLDPFGVNSRSAQGPLWASNQIAALGWTKSLIGKYNAQQNLGRGLGGTLPTSTQKQNLLNSTSFNNYGNFRFELEANLHDPPHGWVGGRMQDMYVSPLDPVFYIHHAMVDYLWQLWTEDGHTVSFSESYMPTFDDEVPGFPYVDPDDIRNSVTQMGIFYGNPDLPYLSLHSYTVNNERQNSEYFVYPDAIQVEASFHIGPGAVAQIHSCESVLLKPGFSIPAGARVTIGTDGFCNTVGAEATLADLELPDNTPIAEEPPVIPESVTLKGFPNPFQESFTFQFTLPQGERVSLVLMDGMGRVVATPMPAQGRTSGEHQLLVDAHDLPDGIYSAVLRLHDSNQRYVLRVVKH